MMIMGCTVTVKYSNKFEIFFFFFISAKESVGLVTLPDRVLGSPGAFWMKSGVAMAPIFSRTEHQK